MASGKGFAGPRFPQHIGNPKRVNKRKKRAIPPRSTANTSEMQSKPTFLPPPLLPLRPTKTRPPNICATHMRQHYDSQGVEYITLESFLKVQGIAETGGRAKMMIASGLVQVNGHVDRRRGRKLRHGDVVCAQQGPDDVSMPVQFV